MSIDFSYLILILNLTPEDSNVLSFTGLPSTISQVPLPRGQHFPLLNKYLTILFPFKIIFLINANSKSSVCSEVHVYCWLFPVWCPRCSLTEPLLCAGHRQSWGQRHGVCMRGSGKHTGRQVNDWKPWTAEVQQVALGSRKSAHSWGRGRRWDQRGDRDHVTRRFGTSNGRWVWPPQQQEAGLVK